MWQELDQIPWRTLRHNFRTATDVPELLRGSADPDPDRAIDAFADLAAIGTPAASAAPIARVVLADPRRLGDGGGWRALTEDEEIRAAAAVLAAS